MAILYKQILSDVEDKFKIDAFENDRQMLETINQFYLETKNDLTSIKDCFEQYLTEGNLETIYIKKDCLTYISQTMFKDWGFVNRALENYADHLKLNKTKKGKFLKLNAYSIRSIQSAIDEYTKDFEADDIVNKNIAQFFAKFKVYNKDKEKDEYLITRIENAYQQAKGVLSIEKLDEDRREPKKGKYGGKGFSQVEKIKQLLDSIMAVVQFVKPLYLVKSGKMIEVDGEIHSDFYDTFEGLYRNVSFVINIYNKTRNYITKKPYSIDKFKINFENSTLLYGWDVNKEKANSGILLIKDGRYYLGIMRKDATDIFNYIPEPDDAAAKKKIKDQLRQQIIADAKDTYYEKMVYKQIGQIHTQLPRIILCSKKNRNLFEPNDQILKIYESDNFKKGDSFSINDLHILIDFYKACLQKYQGWKIFSFNLSPTKSYENIGQFYKEVAEQGYNIFFDQIKANYIDEKVKSGELYLFEIYSKDFSSYSKGRPNLHTSYWKLLFSKENLNDLVLKLNGHAEIFLRPASLSKDKTDIHKAKQSINNKNPLNPKKQSKFDYDIVKNRRFTKDKFFFHCPVTLNFRAASIAGRFNDDVNEYLKDNPDINIIGIDRGERHLLYYSVIDKNRNIIDQDSFNIVESSYESSGRDIEIKTDYHKLLDEKEKQRGAARKSWSTIENIKELKSGYLSHIIHKIALLMIKHNAIVVLEDLNFGFKRGRFKVEKQVYQKFEKVLIDKLNYLVFKDKKTAQAGHYLSAYQLTAPFESFQKLKKQSGFLFYVLSNYTSKIDPVTGFVNLLDTTYKSVEQSKEFFKKFDNIAFNTEKDYFEFSFNYANFPPDKSGKKKKWTTCAAGKERYRYNPKTKETICFDVTEELTKLFNEYGINYKNGENLVNAISNNDKAEFFKGKDEKKGLLFLLGLTLQLRHRSKDEDFILSPVADKDGNFFDSRKAKKYLPKDADANGAFNIARKGLMVLEQIKKEGEPDVIKNAEWFNFVQNTK